MSSDLGLDLTAEQVAQPRAFKSHLGWNHVPKGGRYLVSLRHPGDVLVSDLRFMEVWFVEPDTISIEQHARESFMRHEPGRGYWAHLLSWWEHRADQDVLLLAYEEMRLDLPETILRVADFIGLPLDQDLLEIVVLQSSVEFMTQHQDRFDDLLMRERSEQVAGLPPGSDSAKVRTGAVGSSKLELSSEIQAELDARWTEEITPRVGLPNYGALLQELRAAR